MKRRLRQLVAANSVLAVRMYQSHRDFDGQFRGLRDDTDIVVDAFPRSANTAFSRKLIVAQDGDLRIAHHLHSPGIIIAAVRRGIPAVTILRRPREAIVSFAVYMYPKCSNVSCLLDVAIREYVGYYAPLGPIADKLAIVCFEDATSNFASTVAAINARLGMHLRSGQNTDNFEVESNRYILASHQHFHGDSLGSAERNPMPSADRDALKARFHMALGAPVYRKRLAKADAIYDLLARQALHVEDDRKVAHSSSCP